MQNEKVVQAASILSVVVRFSIPSIVVGRGERKSIPGPGAAVAMQQHWWEQHQQADHG